MSTLNDLILSVTGGPTVNDGLMSYFGGSGPLNDRERAWLIGQGVSPGPLNDMWMRYLGGIGYDGALNDRLYQFWAAGGPSAFYLNVAENSAWENASGSVAGADFIAPTSWGLSFWPPDNAIVLPAADAQVRFVANNNRGFFNQNFDAASVPLGQLFNISVYVDELNAPTSNLVMGCSGVAQMISQTFPVVQGRNSAVYQTTAASGIVNFRIGLGITANATGDVTLSRPQVTLGEFLRPYRRTTA